jgi:argininosuccinate lyase
MATCALLTVMKAQPLAYNKDNQEDKAVFDVVDTLLPTLAVVTALVSDAGRSTPGNSAAATRATRPPPILPTTRSKGIAVPRCAQAVASGAACRVRSVIWRRCLVVAALPPLIENDVYAVLTLEG